MKVLLVHDYATETGGAELQMLALRNGLRARGHHVRLFSSNVPLADGTVLADEACSGHLGTRWQAVSQTLNVSAYWRLRRLLRTFRPDVVHVRMFLSQLSPLILPLLRETPAIYHVAWYKAICPRGTKSLRDNSPCAFHAGVACLQNRCVTPQSWVLHMLQMHLWNRWRHVFDRTVGLSHAVRRHWEAAGLGPIDVVYNGIAERPLRPPLADPPTVAFAGRLVPEKGVDVLLRAFARVTQSVPGARLLIAGDGPERERIRALIAERNLAACVILLGQLSREELESRFESAWVQAVPSLWDEPFGNVTTEAMMRGTPVIASRIGGPAEVIQDGLTGFLVPPGDEHQWAAALERVLGDRTLAEEMGRAGHDRACEEFSESRVVDRFCEMYAELCGQPAEPSRCSLALETSRSDKELLLSGGPSDEC